MAQFAILNLTFINSGKKVEDKAKLPQLVIGLLSLLLSVPGHAKGPLCHSLFVISGGGSPTSNHERYYESIERAHEAFATCPVSNFVTTGKAEDKVTLTYDFIRVPKPDQPKKFMKVSKLLLDEDNLPVLQSKVPQGGFQGAASFEDIKAAAGNLAFEKEKKLGLFERRPEPKPVIVYVTDHGVLKEDKGEIVLWDDKHLSVPQLSEIINSFPPKQPVVMLFDQCYGGDMLKALWNKDGKIRPNSCGLAAASPGQVAFSTGGVMKKIHQLLVEKDLPPRLKKKKSFSYRDVYEALAYEEEIRSTPILSSDLFASEWINQKVKTTPNAAGAAAYWETINAQNLLAPPEDHCFGKKDGPASSSLPSPIQKKLKKEWEGIREEYLELAPKEKSTSDLMKQLKDETVAADKAYERFQNYVAQRYNRPVRERAEKLYKHFDSYSALKARENEGQKLAEAEQTTLARMQYEIDLLKLTIKDEAKIASRHPGAAFKTNPDAEIIEKVLENEKRKKKKNETSNQMFKTQHKLVKLATMNFLDKVMSQGDVLAAETYLQLLECENSTLGEF